MDQWTPISQGGRRSMGAAFYHHPNVWDHICFQFTDKNWEIHFWKKREKQKRIWGNSWKNKKKWLGIYGIWFLSISEETGLPPIQKQPVSFHQRLNLMPNIFNFQCWKDFPTGKNQMERNPICKIDIVSQCKTSKAGPMCRSENVRSLVGNIATCSDKSIVIDLHGEDSFASL